MAQTKEIQLSDAPKKQEEQAQIVDNPESYQQHLQSNILQTDLSNFVKDYQTLLKDRLLKRFAPDFIKSLLNKKVIKPLNENQKAQLNEMIQDNNKDHADKLQAYLRANIIQNPAIGKFQKAKEQKKRRIAQKLARIGQKVQKIGDKIRTKKCEELLVKFTQYREKTFKRFQPNYKVEQELNHLIKRNERISKQRQENLRKKQQQLIQSIADQIYKLDFKSLQKRYQN